jgi:hypothetical protein
VSHLATDLRTWSVREAQVEEDDVGFDPGKSRQRGVGVGGEVDGESFALQTDGERISIRGVIVDDKNCPSMLFRSYFPTPPPSPKAAVIRLVTLS